MQIRVLSSLEDIAPDTWNSLAGTDNPFLSHAFLSGLERHGTVSPENGWQASHLLLETDQGNLLAAMPAYLKAHSWGEFVFDWAWADAYARHGLDYYPKLIVGVPFSPVNGPRLLTADDMDPIEAGQALQRGAEALCRQQGWSSAHCLFPEETLARQLAEQGWLLRCGTQFHWHNADYKDFDHFLATFSSRKRKNVRRERRLAQQQGLAFRMVPGNRVKEEHWADFHRHYAKTFHEHGNLPLMSEAFFQDLGRRLGGQVLMSQALAGDSLVASALFLRSESTLYGRYWGCDTELDGVHFETCYYQGIDYCIQQGLRRFEPGAQGEHKIARGFMPVTTWSAHWIADPRFRDAIADFLRRETPLVEHYRLEMARHGPYKDQEAKVVASQQLTGSQ